jgi:hypothetical protein
VSDFIYFHLLLIFQALSGASYDYMKLCVNELKAQLQDIDSNSDRKLVQSAFEDRNNLVRQGHVQDQSGFNNNITNSAFSGHARRHNPFDDDSFDRGSMSSRSESISEKKARTFLEMHEEFKQEIKEITQEWLKTHQQSLLAEHLKNSVSVT